MSADFSFDTNSTTGDFYYTGDYTVTNSHYNPDYVLIRKIKKEIISQARKINYIVFIYIGYKYFVRPFRIDLRITKWLGCWIRAGPNDYSLII